MRGGDSSLHPNENTLSLGAPHQRAGLWQGQSLGLLSSRRGNNTFGINPEVLLINVQMILEEVYLVQDMFQAFDQHIRVFIVDYRIVGVGYGSAFF